MTPRPARDEVREVQAKPVVRMPTEGLSVLLSAAAFGGCSSFIDICFDVDSQER
jgi:hypothetical protein